MTLSRKRPLSVEFVPRHHACQDARGRVIVMLFTEIGGSGINFIDITGKPVFPSVETGAEKTHFVKSTFPGKFMLKLHTVMSCVNQKRLALPDGGRLLSPELNGAVITDMVLPFAGGKSSIAPPGRITVAGGDETEQASAFFCRRNNSARAERQASSCSGGNL